MPRPVVVGGRKEFCSRAIPGPGPSQNSALSGTPAPKVQGTNTISDVPAFSLAFSLIRSAGILPPPAAPLLGRSVIKSRVSGKASHTAFAASAPRSAFGLFNLAAIPPGTVSFLLCGRSSRAFRIAAVRPRQKRRKAFRASRTRPSASAPGRWRRQCRDSATLHPPQTARFCPHQRRGVLLLFEGRCLFAFTLIPHSTVRTALTPLGRPGPGRGGRLPTLRAGLFRCSREPSVSLPRRSRARRPQTQDRLRGHAPLRSAPYGTA